MQMPSSNPFPHPLENTQWFGVHSQPGVDGTTSDCPALLVRTVTHRPSFIVQGVWTHVALQVVQLGANGGMLREQPCRSKRDPWPVAGPPQATHWGPLGLFLPCFTRTFSYHRAPHPRASVSQVPVPPGPPWTDRWFASWHFLNFLSMPDEECRSSEGQVLVLLPPSPLANPAPGYPEALSSPGACWQRQGAAVRICA